MPAAGGCWNLHPGTHTNHQKSHCYCASTYQQLILRAFLANHFAWVDSDVVMVVVVVMVAMSIVGSMIVFMIVIAIAVVLMRHFLIPDLGSGQKGEPGNYSHPEEDD